MKDNAVFQMDSLFGTFSFRSFKINGLFMGICLGEWWHKEQETSHTFPHRYTKDAVWEFASFV